MSTPQTKRWSNNRRTIVETVEHNAWLWLLVLVSAVVLAALVARELGVNVAVGAWR